MLSKLTYSKKIDEFETVTVLGSPDGIQDLYYLLLECDHIEKITLSNLDGYDYTQDKPAERYSNSSRLDHGVRY